MGCTCSTDKALLQQAQELIIKLDPTREGIFSSKALKDMTVAITAIKKNDAFLIAKLLQKRQPDQILMVSEFNNNFLHFAAKYNSYKAAELIITWIKNYAPHIYPEFVNSSDIEGRKPVMICAVNDSPETLYVLLTHGMIQEEALDKDHKNLTDLCKQHSSTCSIVYEKIKNNKGKPLFPSLKKALNGIAKIKQMSETLKKTFMMKAVTKKIKTIFTKKKAPEKAIMNNDKDNKDDKDNSSDNEETVPSPPIKEKKKRDFNRIVIWCKNVRNPCYDTKFDRSVSMLKGFPESPRHLMGGSAMHKFTHQLKTDKSNTKIIELEQQSPLRFDRYVVKDVNDNRNMFEVQSDGSNEDSDDSEDYEERDDIHRDHTEVEQSIMNGTLGEHAADEDEDFLAHYRIISLNTFTKAMQTQISKNSKTYMLIEDCISQNNNYVDTAFPPEQSIIGQEWISKHTQTAILWSRPHEIFRADYDEIHLFDNIDPNDIEQGKLGVCYFLAAISALAEFPERVQKIFINNDSNEQGVYGVRFYIQGIPTEITMDDYIPCAKEGFFGGVSPIFSKPKGNEIWVQLLEKAWAKVFGTYSIIESGISDEAFEHILGVPSFLYLAQNQSLDKIWKKLYSADKNNYITSASTYQSVNESVGLAAAHTYSVISAQEIEGYKILKLRNPWGRFEWNGDFSDSSPLWTPKIKEEMGYVDADDGMFCMTVEDFKKYFMGYVIAEYRSYWQYSYITGQSKHKKSNFFKFTINEPVEVYLRIHQRNERFKDTDGYYAADFKIARVEGKQIVPVVFKPRDTDDTAIFGHHSISPSRHHKIYLKHPGQYIIRVKMILPPRKTADFTLSSYASKRIELENCEKLDSFLTGFFLHIGDLAKHKEYMDFDCSIARGFSGFHHYLYMENKGEYTWKLVIRFPELVNAKLGRPYRTSEDTLEMTLAPGEERIAYLNIIEPKDPKTFVNPEFENEWY